MIDVHIDATSEAEFNRILQGLADATDRPVEEVLRQQGRLLANDLAFRIKPYGVAPAKGKDFQRNIEAMVKRLYHNYGWVWLKVKNTHGEAAAASIVRLLNSGKWDQAESLLNGRLRPTEGDVSEFRVGHFDGGRLHREWRWRKRRRYPCLIVPTPDWEQVKAYARREAELAGFAKASLVNAGRQLDGKTGGAGGRPSRWITRHLSAPGIGHLSKVGKTFGGYIRSLVTYIRSALPPAEESEALRIRYETAAKLLQRITDYNLRRAMRRQRGR